MFETAEKEYSVKFIPYRTWRSKSSLYRLLAWRRMRPGVSNGYYFQVNQYGKIVFDSVEEEADAYDQMLQDVIDQPRYFLDNLDKIMEFKVSWLNYSSKEYCKKTGRNYAISHPKYAQEVQDDDSI